MHGCPLGLDRQLLAVTLGSADTERIVAALGSLGAVPQPGGDEFHGLHAVESWALPNGGTIELVATPAGTYGFSDLRRDVRLFDLGPGLTTVPVASVADLVRIADASPRPVDRAWRSALRTLAERTGRPQQTLSSSARHEVAVADGA